MLKVPVPNKANWKKILRELDLANYPSLPNKLKIFKDRLQQKEKLSVLDEVVGLATLKKYFEDFHYEINANYVRNVDYNKFKKFPPLAHQKDAVEFLLKTDRAILADTMGKGKTMSSIYSALSMDEDARILVISTKSLKYNFASEIARLTDDYAVIEKKWVNAKFVLINYDNVKKLTDNILDFKPDIIICDEAHEIKNMQTSKFKNLWELLKQQYPNKLWLLTGTPIANRPLEFYALLKLLKHPLAKSWENYVVRYCNAQKDYFGRWQTNGASNLKELREMTKHIILRRVNKKGDLPPYQRIPYYIDMSKDTKIKYENCVNEFEKNKKKEIAEELAHEGLSDFAAHYEANSITKLVIHRMFCAAQKLEDESLKKMIHTYLQEDPTNKIILFTNYISVVDNIHKEYKDISLKLDGRVKEAYERQQLVEKFNNDPNLRLFICNLKVGSTGHNIQSANIVIVNDMDWVPNTMLQAECRAWRFGQERECKFIYPIYRDTVEEILFNIINEKMRIISELVDGNIEEYFDSEEMDKKQLEFEEITKDDILKEIFAQLKI